jgi:F-type H+-transporting ATPase subunit b
MASLLHDAEFWVAVAFVIFIALLVKFGAFKMLLGELDKRGERIASELDEAKRLRTDAEALLASYEKRRHEAEAEAAAIIAQAKVEAERLAKEAEAKLADFVARRQKSAEEKIAQAETEAAREVRNAAAEAAIGVSEAILRLRSSGAAGSALLAKSLDEIKAKLN